MQRPGTVLLPRRGGGRPSPSSRPTPGASKPRHLEAPSSGRAAHRGHRRGVAELVARCTSTTTGPLRDLVRHSGVVLQGLTYARSGCHRGRAHHEPARRGRQRPDLGLPLHLGARREHDAAGSLRRGLPRRGRPILRVPRPGGRHAARPRARTCRSCSASVASATSPSASSATSPGGEDSGPVRVGNDAWSAAPARRLRRRCSTPPTRSATSSTTSTTGPDAFLVAAVDAAAARWQ